MSTRETFLFASSYQASIFLHKFRSFASLVCCSLRALLSHFSVARATRHCRYSCPVQRYWLNKACIAAPRGACMHAHSSSSIEHRPQFGSLTRSWIWICAFRMVFFFGVWIHRIGSIFPFPSSLSTWKVRLRCMTAADYVVLELSRAFAFVWGLE